MTGKRLLDRLALALPPEGKLPDGHRRLSKRAGLPAAACSYRKFSIMMMSLSLVRQGANRNSFWSGATLSP